MAEKIAVMDLKKDTVFKFREGDKKMWVATHTPTIVPRGVKVDYRGSLSGWGKSKIVLLAPR
jgi:hypothetical protein